MRTRPALLDFLIIAAIGAIAIALFALPFLRPTGESVTVVARRGGATETLYEGDLDKNATVEIEKNGISLTVCIENGEVFVAFSECSDKICENSGKISRSGQSIICAPAGVAVNIGGGELDEDISAG